MAMENFLSRKHWNAYKNFTELITSLDNGEYELSCSKEYLQTILAHLDLGMYQLQVLLDLENRSNKHE
jgi:hypothetical protein